MKKPKSAKQTFMEGLKQARLDLTPVRGHYVTPDELGEDVGVSGQTIRNYESGESEPTLEMIERLAAVLGVPLAWPPFDTATKALTLMEELVPAVDPVKQKRRRRGNER